MLHLRNPSRPVLMIEFVLLMLGLPLAMVYILPVKLVLPIIWLMAWACHYCVRKMEHIPTALPVRPEALTRENLQPILRRFAINAALLTVLTLLFKPELFLNFVMANPMFWAVVMLAYPLISVVPQEIIYRVYFFSRYTPLFKTPQVMVLASALAFGFAHVLFQNWVAPVLCAIGGFLFASTYRRTGSLALVALEHALYGDFIFTLGLGRYFYHGAVGH